MPAGRAKTQNRYRRGVTLSETLVTAATIAVILIVIGLGLEGIRTELKRDQAVELMRTLDQALLAYQQATRHWPVDVGMPAETLVVRADSTELQPDPAGTDRVIEAMAGVTASRTVLESLPAALRMQPPQGVVSTPADWGSVQDPWGRRLHCLTSASPLPAHRKAVAANRNRPIFISAGPDGRFGFADVAAASDNIRSDEISH
jgi:hypothetical protein